MFSVQINIYIYILESKNIVTLKCIVESLMKLQGMLFMFFRRQFFLSLFFFLHNLIHIYFLYLATTDIHDFHK